MKSIISKLNILNFSKIARVAVLLTTLPLVLTFSSTVSAQDEEEGRRAPPAARSSQSLSRPVYERLEEIMELRDEGDIAGADEVLLELRNMHDRGRLNDAEELSMWRFYANFAALEENYEEAIIYQELILAMDEDALPPDARE